MKLFKIVAAEAPGREDADQAAARAVWRAQAEREGPVRVLQWSGIGFATAKWLTKHALLHRGQLHIFEDDSLLGPQQTVTVYIDR